MFVNPLRSKTTVILAAATVAGLISSANAAVLTFTSGTGNSAVTGNATIVSDTGDRHTVANTSPIPVDYDIPLTGLYGAPTITSPSGVVKFDFLNLSSQFRSTASSAMYNATESVDTDGKLVLNLSFSSPVSLGASIYEDGLVSTTSGGSFQILGGGVEIEADDANQTNPEQAALAATTNTTTSGNTTSGGWVATATLPGYNGFYSNYTITIDNDLLALATANGNVASTADIYKKDFILTLTTTTNGGSGRTPEPASVGLLVLGATAMLARRRR